MKIKLLRIEKGYAQKVFAEKLGITQQYLRLIELDKIDLRKSLMIKISKLLEVTPQELFFSEEN